MLTPKASGMHVDSPTRMLFLSRSLSQNITISREKITSAPQQQNWLSLKISCVSSNGAVGCNWTAAYLTQMSDSLRKVSNEPPFSWHGLDLNTRIFQGQHKLVMWNMSRDEIRTCVPLKAKMFRKEIFVFWTHFVLFVWKAELQSTLLKIILFWSKGSISQNCSVGPKVKLNCCNNQKSSLSASILKFHYLTGCTLGLVYLLVCKLHTNKNSHFSSD